MNPARAKTGMIAAAVAGAALFYLLHDPPQRNDPDFDARIAQPAYTSRHPVVLFDDALSKGLYQPFLDLIRNDGYRVRRTGGPIDAGDLAGVDIVAVAIVMGFQEGQKTLPGLRHGLKGDAFPPEECALLANWVHRGGSLLAASDYAVTARSAATLLEQFGLRILDGWAIEPVNHDPASGRQGFILFTRGNGGLADDEVTRGITRVMSFTGQAMLFPPNAMPFLRLSPDARLIPYREDQPPVPFVPAPRSAQGVALESGKGRVVALGEATMLTAMKVRANRVSRHLGMSLAGSENRQLALNIMHWLSRAP